MISSIFLVNKFNVTYTVTKRKKTGNHQMALNAKSFGNNLNITFSGFNRTLPTKLFSKIFGRAKMDFEEKSLSFNRPNSIGVAR
jgi:hypothetical protein